MREETKKLIYTDRPPTTEELKRWQQSAPYFVLPAFCALKRDKQLDAREREKLLGRVAIQASDREALYDLIGEDTARFANFYPDRKEQPTTTTENTIDSFLENFGHSNQRETEALTRMIFNPVPSYEATLAAEVNGNRRAAEAARKSREMAEAAAARAEKEALESPAEEPELPQTEELPGNKRVKAPSETGNLSESFAKMMIRNGNYEKALEIITGLSLNNPEKSIYFADQIRFLQKLIINKNKRIN